MNVLIDFKFNEWMHQCISALDFVIYWFDRIDVDHEKPEM